MSDAIISYAAFILADAGKDITAENLETIAKAAGAKVDSTWAEVYAAALEGKDLKEILAGFHAAGPAAGAASAGAGAGGAAEEAAEAAEEEVAEESDDDMGFGLFD